MSMNAIVVVIFELGEIVATSNALQALAIEDIMTGLHRHRAGDWGELSPEDIEANNQALVEGSRILSAYSSKGVKFWIITEADRSATTVLLPEDY